MLTNNHYRLEREERSVMNSHSTVATPHFYVTKHLAYQRNLVLYNSISELSSGLGGFQALWRQRALLWRAQSHGRANNVLPVNVLCIWAIVIRRIG